MSVLPYLLFIHSASFIKFLAVGGVDVVVDKCGVVVVVDVSAVVVVVVVPRNQCVGH